MNLCCQELVEWLKDQEVSCEADTQLLENIFSLSFSPCGFSLFKRTPNKIQPTDIFFDQGGTRTPFCKVSDTLLLSFVMICGPKLRTS